jgi:hydrogenase maturation protease
MQTVILGLGNELLGDEGVGVHSVRLLQQEKLPENIEIIEVGTAILDALPAFENAERIIVIDAMKDGMSPGTIYKTSIDQCSGSQCIASMHGFDIFRTMALAGRSDSPQVMVFGVEPEMIGWSMELSDQVAKSIPHLIEAVKQELTC